jgi:uncharacterized protein YgfB (UPF0149 family)
MQDDISGWNDWEAAFGDIPELAGPSELHGLLMGIVSVAQAPSTEQWQHILEQLDISAISDHALQLLTEEGEDVASALADDSFDYMPLLPDDQHVLQERVAALASWCEGVVLGFGLASGKIRADEAELLKDLQDVAAVEFDEQDDDEEGEASYADLVEFVRLIPVSLSTGRTKHDLTQTALFNPVKPPKVETLKAVEPDNISIVEMFTPERPS